MRRWMVVVLLCGCGASSPNGGDAGPDAPALDMNVPPVVCEGDCHYVREGASGQGTSWDDAFGALPATLVRGHVYFVAAGSYPGYTFDDAAGATIRVRRATENDHGDGVGWTVSYGTGSATFGPLAFETAGYEFDGRDATVVRGDFQGTVVSIDADRITLRGTELDGAFAAPGGTHTAGACSLLDMGGDDLVVAGNLLHDAADDGVAMSGARILFAGNQVRALHGCGTDGGCGPCYNGHSDGLELYAVTDSTFTGNYVHHVSSTAAVFFGNWADELGNGSADYCRNVTMTNNVFYSPDTGFAVYFEDVDGLFFANNFVWGRHQGAYGGLAIGTNVDALDMINNVILSVNYAHLGATYDAQEHRGDHNFFAIAQSPWPTQPEDLVGLDPGFVGLPNADGADVPGATAEDFALETTSPLRGQGTTGARIPTIDYFGTTRANPPTIGAVE